MRGSIADFLARANPLTKAIAVALLAYAEEDDRLDFKQTLDPANDRDWLELTKDITAFANTHGGYLVFGVEDKAKTVTGIPRSLAQLLKDCNNINQKVNRYLYPEITSLRSNEYRFNGKSIVVLHIPCSAGRTHVISKDGAYRLPSGEQKRVLCKGTFYVRRSGGNHLADARDLEDLIERRVEQFRDSLMGKVARIVEAPVESQVFVLSRDKDSENGARFVIEDSPDAIAVKGMSFSISPDGPEEEIASWAALCKDRYDAPPASYVWTWYASRDSLGITAAHRLTVFRFSLWTGAPAYYWMRGQDRRAILEELDFAIRHRPEPTSATNMLDVAKFLGKGAHSRVVAGLGRYTERLNAASLDSARPTFDVLLGRPVRRDDPSELATAIESLDAIANAAAASGRQPGVMERSNAWELDRFAYAQLDWYKPRTSA